MTSHYPDVCITQASELNKTFVYEDISIQEMSCECSSALYLRDKTSLAGCCRYVGLLVSVRVRVCVFLWLFVCPRVCVCAVFCKSYILSISRA